MTRKQIVILTGAGISAESGVSTFRDAGGVWAKYDYRDVATPEGFQENPEMVHEFYNHRRASLASAKPNAAHFALARLEEQFVRVGGNLTLITQNVDDLHERAGSKSLLHMHGELTKIRCNYCNDVCHHAGDISVRTKCIACNKTAGMRPHIVWFGEMPMFMDEIETAIACADLFVSIGTSGAVYPAAGLVTQARANGATAMELNLEESDNAHLFTKSRYGKAGEIVPEWVEDIIGEL